MQVEAWLERAACSAPTHTALESKDAQVSYADLFARARVGACELHERGVRRGERVAIALPAGIEFAQALHACFLTGAIAVPLDLRLTAAERERLVGDVALTIEQPLASEPSDKSAKPRFTHDLDAVCVVIYTSGTTSAPQPIELTYGNFLWSALGSAVALGVDPKDRWLCTLPLAHVGGLSILLRSAIYATTAVMHERFSSDAVLRALEREGITLLSLVSTTLARLLDAGLQNPPHLRCALTGGGPVPAALMARARAAAVPVLETYGLTECCSQAATAPLAALGSQASTAPLPALGSQASTAPLATLEDGDWQTEPNGNLGAGVPLFCTRTEIARDGEILLSGPTIAQCSLESDGCLHTGDLGSIDAYGFLHVTGRKADTIVSGGENVAPSEVEAVLESYPGVIEAAVVGREDQQWGEAVTAIVVTGAQTSLQESALREHCASRLAAFKVPKRIEFATTPLPRTRSGKLLRREL